MKKALLFILLIIPFIAYADECDKDKHKEFLILSENITYDNNYSKSSSSFTITIYNVFDGMYAKYNKVTYKSDDENTITIEKIPGGENVNIDIYGKDNCSSLKRIIVNEPYYNKYYGSSLCEGYENKLLMCSSQFTSTEVTRSTLEKAIYNYDHSIKSTDNKKEEETEETFASKFTAFITSWGIKIALAVISTIFSISLFNDKYRKVKHGI